MPGRAPRPPSSEPSSTVCPAERARSLSRHPAPPEAERPAMSPWRPRMPIACASRRSLPVAKTCMPASGPSPAAAADTARSTSLSRRRRPATTSWALTRSASTRCGSTAPARFSGRSRYRQHLKQGRWAIPRWPTFARHAGRRGAEAASRVRELGFAPLFENSGYKGRHYWVFLEQPESADLLHLVRQTVSGLADTPAAARATPGVLSQASRAKGKGLGNLIKLPLGIHRRTGRPRPARRPEPAPAEPLAALPRHQRCGAKPLYAAWKNSRRSSARDRPPSRKPPLSLPIHPGRLRRRRGPTPPAPAPTWTEADFETDPRFHHLLQHCPVLAELKRKSMSTAGLSHDEQLVLIHTLGHLEGGPLAVNYLFSKCLDIGPEKFLKDRLKGNPVSCPSIRKKIGHVTRRVPCNCPFEYAPDRYPTPVLHLLTLPPAEAIPAPAAPAVDAESLARRYGVLTHAPAELDRDCQELEKGLRAVLRSLPDRAVACPGGRYRLIEREGIEELLWEVISH